MAYYTSQRSSTQHAPRQSAPQHAPRQPAPQQEPDLLTVSEVAKQLRVDDTTVRRWIKSGALEAVSLPHTGIRQAYRVRRSTMDALLESGTPLPAGGEDE